MMKNVVLLHKTLSIYLKAEFIDPKDFVLFETNQKRDAKRGENLTSLYVCVCVCRTAVVLVPALRRMAKRPCGILKREGRILCAEKPEKKKINKCEKSNQQTPLLTGEAIGSHSNTLFLNACKTHTHTQE